MLFMTIKIFFFLLTLITVLCESIIFIDPFFAETPNINNNTFGSMGQFFTNFENIYPNETDFTIYLSENIRELENLNAIIHQNIMILPKNPKIITEAQILSKTQLEIHGFFEISGLIFNGNSGNFYFNFDLQAGAVFSIKVNSKIIRILFLSFFFFLNKKT